MKDNIYESLRGLTEIAMEKRIKQMQILDLNDLMILVQINGAYVTLLAELIKKELDSRMESASWGKRVKGN
jgi:hypothetical protein